MEVAPLGIFDKTVFRAVDGIASGDRGILENRQLRRRNVAGRSGQERERIPGPSKLQRVPVNRGRTRNDSMKILRIPLRLGQPFAAALGAADEIVAMSILSVKGAQDGLGLN